MARLGDSIDPRLFLQDFSGFAQAANTEAQGIIGLGNKIDAVNRDYAKEQKEAKNTLKASQAQIDAAIQLFPDQAGRLTAIANELKNEDAPLSERAAVASGIADMIAMGVGEKRYQADQSMRLRDQDLRERESSLRQLATTQDIQQQERKQTAIEKAMDLDETTQNAAGPVLAQYVKSALPASMANGINLDGLTGTEQYALATSLSKLIPDEKKKDLQIVDIPIGGGSTKKMAFDPASGSVSDLQAPEILLPPGASDPTNPDLPVFTPADASDEELGMVLPPINGFGVTPPDPAKALDIQQKQLAIQAAKDAAKVTAAAKVEAKSVNQRVVDTIDKYLTPDGNPKDALKDAVGFGEGVGSFMGGIPFVPGGNSAETRANQKQLQLDLLEQDLLNAAKNLKPVSEDEMKQLMARRPTITDPPETWAWFMNRAKSIIANDANAPIVSPSGPNPVDRAAEASSKLRGLLPR